MCVQKGVVFRDIKPENALVNETELIGHRHWPLLKLCDFGLSKSDTNSLPKTAVGTVGYTGTGKHPSKLSS